jgi:SAM-dependent methyltransferase
LLYDSIGKRYSAVRREDPRIAARIRLALGDARTVVNVGAGTGSYEPRDLELIAVEPSEVMIAQRPEGAAPVIRGVAEELPFEDGSFNAAMAVLSDHHWPDRARGIAEMRRVAQRVVILTFDPATTNDSWLVREYLPGFADIVTDAFRLEEIVGYMGGAHIEAVPVPHDCTDGFMHAYWRRPRAYLDPRVRAGISAFAQMEPRALEKGIARLREDLESGEWERRHAELLELDELDLGYRLLVHEGDPPAQT